MVIFRLSAPVVEGKTLSLRTIRCSPWILDVNLHTTMRIVGNIHGHQKYVLQHN
eukprot:m.27372 g.27372  ORF g.27372 m.27372 type:complete len:54 (-) comp13414_c0_seq2:3126-3287(-)